MSQPDQRFATFAEIARERQSIRAFKPKPVPRTVLDRVLEIAQTSPSNCNTQPWLTYVVSGARRDRLAAGLRAAALEQRYNLDYPYIGSYDGVYRTRQHEAAAQLYNAMGIAREEKQRRRDALLQNYDFFGAPHAIILCMHDWCGLREAADVGMYAQTLLLALTAHGIGSVPQTALGMYADVVREQLELPADQKVLFGISLGYADESPSNQFRMARADLQTTARFLD